MGGHHRFSNFEIAVLLVMFCVVGLIDAPQIIKASEEVKLSRLIESLELMRSRLDVYRSEHDWSLPPSDSYEAFEAALIKKKGQKGPYIDEMPKNPFNGLRSVRFDGEPAGCGMAGWRLDTKNGDFFADNDLSYAGL
ncbi:MAG: hypothetical protein ACYSSP_06680 [Planctomycetota bacterium]|jgi:type II secretory pathway pseudopilin PulG